MIKIESQKVFTVSLVCLVVITAISWLINQFAPGTLPNLKVGFIFILFGVVILLTTVFTLGLNISTLKIKDIIFMIIILAILVALYIFLPSVIPNVFSIIPGNEINYQIRDFFSKTLGSVAGMMGTGVTS
jgi:ABC-type transport system involved in multi-copper enzyme maturation permease subunit